MSGWEAVRARLEVEAMCQIPNGPCERCSDIRAALAEVERLREDSDRLRFWATGLVRETQRLHAIEAALAEWRKHDSAPDCVACAALDAATCEPLRVEDLLAGLPRLSTPEESVRIMGDGQRMVKMREIP